MKSRLSALSLDFCGVACENPFFLSSSCVGNNAEMCQRALAAGWGGVVFKTIGFYKSEEVSPRFDTIRKEGADFVGFRNMEQISEHALEENLAALRQLKKSFPQKVLVASIMGQSEPEWEELASLMEQEGADIIECNFSCPQMAEAGMGADVGVSPVLVENFCRAVRRGTKLPVLAKMTPNLADMTVPAKAALAGGASGISAINTIKCITNIDDQYRVQPSVSGKSCVSGYSGKAVKPIALRFISDLAGDPELAGVPVSGMGGIETWRDALEFFLLGAANVQVTTSVMQYGYRIIEDLTDGLAHYLAEQKVAHLREIIGSSLPGLVKSCDLDRQTLVYPVFDTQRCVGCGRCYISCQDGGHQALTWQPKIRRPLLQTDACVGCHLCRLVCPVEAIHTGRRRQKPVLHG